MSEKVLALIDCNNFFVSCERVFNPSIKSKPTIVLSSNDGCIVSRSGEVKDAGIPMGLPHFKLKQMFDISNIAIFSTNFKLYRDMSLRVMNIIKEIAPSTEVYSIDEAFVDITSIKNPRSFCENMHKKILQYTGIPVSVGIAGTKTLAKLANRIAKDNRYAVHHIEDDIQREEILKNTSIGKIWGVGSGLTLSFSKWGINSAYDLTSQDNVWIQKNYGVVGIKLAQELRGISARDFSTESETRKSIVSSRSFGKEAIDKQTLASSISYHVDHVASQMRREGSATGFLSVSIYTNRHKNVPQNCQTKSIAFGSPVIDTMTLTKSALKLLDEIYQEGFSYKKAGVMVSDFTPQSILPNFDLFGNEIMGKSKVTDSVDLINDKYGEGTVKLASLGFQNKWKSNSQYYSGEYTTKWSDILRIDQNKIG